MKTNISNKPNPDQFNKFPLSLSSLIAIALGESNPFPNIHRQQLSSYISKQALNIYDGKAIDLTSSFEKEVLLAPKDQDLYSALHGGFCKGSSYEIRGPSLSGKTLFINNLLYSNKDQYSKCLFFDFIGSNLWKCNKNNKINVIENYFSLSEVLQELKKNTINNYDLIVFDPLSVILSKELQYDDDIVTEFNKEINHILYKKKMTILYTSSVRFLNETIVYDEMTQRKFQHRDYDSSIPSSFLPINKTEISLYKTSYNDKYSCARGRINAEVRSLGQNDYYIELTSFTTNIH